MATKTYTPRLKALYDDKVVSEVSKEKNVANVNEVPHLEKIVVSIGLGRGKDDKRLFEHATTTLIKITGQQPQETIAKKSIASFKLREGNKVGLKVTLRGDKMYEFLDRLINIVIPRFRDFHGVSVKSFDSTGNYSLGIKEQSVFPELNYEDISVSHGLEVTMVLSEENPELSKAVLEKLGMPFEKVKEKA